MTIVASFVVLKDITVGGVGVCGVGVACGHIVVRHHNSLEGAGNLLWRAVQSTMAQLLKLPHRVGGDASFGGITIGHRPILVDEEVEVPRRPPPLLAALNVLFALGERLRSHPFHLLLEDHALVEARAETLDAEECHLATCRVEKRPLP